MIFRRKARALDSVSLDIAKGVVGLLGPNGAGKSTLLSALATTLKVPPGRVHINGSDLGTTAGRRAARELIGWLPQKFDLAGGMRVDETVAYAAWTNGIDAHESGHYALLALKKVDLDDRAHDRVRHLSGGQRQRLGLAAALAHNPSIILLDEPSVGLDPEQRLKLRSSILAASGDSIVVLSSHLLEDVAQMCDRVAVMNHGRVLFYGSLARLAEIGSTHASQGVKNVEPRSAIEAGYIKVLTYHNGVSQT